MVARYLTELVEGARTGDGAWLEQPRRLATIERRLSAIRQYHRIQGLPFDAHDPALHDTMRGIRRAYSAAPRAKTPTVTEVLRALVQELPPTTLGIRDRALLLLGFAGAFRRSELVAIDFEDCAAHAEGVVVTLHRSRDNPESQGEEIGIPHGAHPETDPVDALAEWIGVADIRGGPLFRPVTRYSSVLPQRLSAGAVSLIVKRVVSAARTTAEAQGNQALADGLDPNAYASHSLRAGFITSAAAAGVSDRDIMRHTRHKRVDSLQKYVRHATVFRHNAAAKVGL